MYANVVFVIRCLYSAVSLTLALYLNWLLIIIVIIIIIITIVIMTCRVISPWYNRTGSLSDWA